MNEAELRRLITKPEDEAVEFKPALLSKRSKTGSVILTSNKAFREWGEVFQDNAVATAIAERLIEHGELVKIEGSNYRVRRRKLKGADTTGSDE